MILDTVCATLRQLIWIEGRIVLCWKELGQFINFLLKESLTECELF